MHNQHGFFTFAVLVWLLAGPLVASEPAASEPAASEPAVSEPTPTPTPSATEGPALDASSPAEHQKLLEAAHSFTRAKLLADEGRIAEALAAYERALELDGSDPYAYLEAARFHSYLAQIARADRKQRLHLETATKYAARARELAPLNNDVLLQFGQVHLRMVEQNHFPSLAVATGAYEELWKQGEEDLSVLLSLGQLYLWQRQSEKAAEVLQAAADRQPNHRMIQVMLVEALIESENTEKVEGALTKLLELDPAALEYRLRLAEFLGDQEHHARAVELLRGAPEDDQTEPALRRMLAQELHLNGENREALALADALLLESEKPPVGLRRLRVAILSSLAQYQAALDELTALLPDEKEPKDIIQQTVLLSRLLERVGRPEEAAQHLRDLVDQQSGRERLQLKLGLFDLLKRQGANDEAAALMREEFDQALATGENVFAFGRLLSDLLSRLERFEEAEAVIDQVRGALPPEATEAMSQLTLNRMAILTEAEAWNDVVAVAPKVEASPNTEVREAGRLFQAEALSQLGRVEEALALLKGTDSRTLFVKRLEILFASGEEAAVHQALAEKIQSDDVEDLFFAAQTYQRLELYSHAIPLLERVVSEGAATPGVLFSLGAAQERSGAHEAAVASFERLLEQEPNFAPALNYLGYMWAERGENLKQAQDMLHRAVANDPDNGAYVDSLGWVYFQLGQYQEALVHMEWATRLVPNDPTIFEHLGDIYLQLGKGDQARDSYRKALELNPEETEDLQRKLQSLETQGL